MRRVSWSVFLYMYVCIHECMHYRPKDVTSQKSLFGAWQEDGLRRAYMRVHTHIHTHINTYIQKKDWGMNLDIHAHIHTYIHTDRDGRG